MIPRRVKAGAVVATACLLAAGCGSKKTEAGKRERERLELEQQARREAEAANKAITDLNQRMFRKKALAGKATPQADESSTAGPVNEAVVPESITEAEAKP